jgi:glycosyltransferase involved in cell wall biosynthesis
MGDVILPVLDEAAALPAVLASLPPGWRPIVVDNGSTDGSGDIARELGAEVVLEPRRGFGAACYAGLVAATDALVAFMDCDGSLDGADLVAVAAPVRDGALDLVLGARTTTARGAWPWHLRFANRRLARTVAQRTGVELTDLGPMRVAWREPLLALDLRDRRFGWPLEMVLRAADAGWRIGEVPVAYRARVGRSKVTGTLGGVVRTVHDMRVALR